MSRRNSERGAAAVEFALLVPILLLLVFGIVEFGRAYHVQSTLAGAAREGVRVVALGGSTGDASARVTNYVGTMTPAPGVTFPDTCAGTGDPDDRATVVVTYDFDFIALVGLVPGVPDSIPLQGTGTMRCNG